MKCKEIKTPSISPKNGANIKFVKVVDKFPSDVLSFRAIAIFTQLRSSPCEFRILVNLKNSEVDPAYL